MADISIGGDAVVAKRRRLLHRRLRHHPRHRNVPGSRKRKPRHRAKGYRARTGAQVRLDRRTPNPFAAKSIFAYDGTSCAGFIIENGTFRAFDPNSKLIGEYSILRAAVRALPFADATIGASFSAPKRRAA